VRFHQVNVAWHCVLAAGAALASPWWLLALVPALARAVLLRPGMRPGAIGGVEAVVAVLVVISAFLAL
jgi:hypothetical protein